MLFKDISYYMFYTLHVVEPLRYDSVVIKETNEWMNEWMNAHGRPRSNNLFGISGLGVGMRSTECHSS